MKRMEKKQYARPSMKVVPIQSRASLLAASLRRLKINNEEEYETDEQM